MLETLWVFPPLNKPSPNSCPIRLRGMSVCVWPWSVTGSWVHTVLSMLLYALAIQQRIFRGSVDGHSGIRWWSWWWMFLLASLMCQLKLVLLYYHIFKSLETDSLKCHCCCHTNSTGSVQSLTGCLWWKPALYLVSCVGESMGAE